MESREGIRHVLSELLSNQRLAVLSTHNSGQPYASLVAFACSLELLDLAQASYRLRDDDNIHLGRIESQLATAVAEGWRRLQSAGAAGEGHEELRAALEDLDFGNRMHPASQPALSKGDRLRPRQLTGQPAGPGVPNGKARVDGYLGIVTVGSGEL